MHYSIQWGVLHVGEASAASSLVQTNGHTRMLLQFSLRSNRFIQTLYPVNYHFISIVEPDTGRPEKFVKRTSEKDDISDDILIFDWERMRAEWTDQRRQRCMQYAIDAQTQDLFAVMTCQRRNPVRQAGDEKAFSVAVGPRVEHLKITAIREEKIHLPGLGEHPAMLVHISSANPRFFARKVPEDAWVGLEGPLKGIVLKFWVRVPIGRASITLRSYDPGRPYIQFPEPA